MSRLEELRLKKVELMEELARGGVKGVLAVEREIRRELQEAPEYLADDPLTEEDVRLWCESRFWKFARTMSQNPHEYTIREWGDDEMFRLVCRFIWDHGYPNEFGGRVFTQYEAGDDFFLWTTQATGASGRETHLTTLINRKPTSLLERNPPKCRWKPTKELRARAAVRRLEVGEGLALSGAEVAVERVDGPRYRWVRGTRSVEVDADEAVRRLAARKADELDRLTFEPPTQPTLGHPTTEREESV